MDALLFTPDKTAAARELARVLRPGGRLALTSWDYHRQPPNRPPQVEDHRPVLEGAGFEILRYDETDHWRERQEGLADGLLDRLDEVAAEVGSTVEEAREGIKEMQATFACMTRRFLVVAECRGA